MYARAAAITLHVRHLGAFLAFMCALSAFCYGAFLLLAVERTATLAKTTGQLQNAQNELSILENRYLAAELQLTPKRAQDLGFVTPPPSAQSFVSINAQTLTFNDNGGH